jgi:hypothetical protein
MFASGTPPAQQRACHGIGLGGDYPQQNPGWTIRFAMALFVISDGLDGKPVSVRELRLAQSKPTSDGLDFARWKRRYDATGPGQLRIGKHRRQIGIRRDLVFDLFVARSRDRRPIHAR